MRNLILLALVLCSCNREKPVEALISEVKYIMQTYPPCHEGWYCYEYEFGLSNNKSFRIVTKRYNYDKERKFLALTTVYSFYADVIKEIEQFPNTDDSIIVHAKDKAIEITQGKETRMVDYIALDFNSLFAYDDQLPILLQNLRKIMNHYQ